MIKAFQYLSVMIQHFEEYWLEGIGFEEDVFFDITFIYSIFDNLVEFHSLGLQFLDIYIRSDDDFVFVEHLNHVVGDAK